MIFECGVEKEPEEDGSQADNAEKLSISPKEDNRKADENAAAENDEGEKARRQYEKSCCLSSAGLRCRF